MNASCLKKLVIVYSLFRQQIYYFNFKYPKKTNKNWQYQKKD